MPEMNLEELMKVGRLQLIVKNIPGFEIVLQTLDSSEMLDVTQLSGDFKKNAMETSIQMQRITLMHAIKKINGKELALNEKQDLINKLQNAVITFLYNEYQTLEQEQEKTLVELKKK